jgi:hypothetical protein
MIPILCALLAVASAVAVLALASRRAVEAERITGGSGDTPVVPEVGPLTAASEALGGAVDRHLDR